ncbi:hypothetical protein [Priestia megaterium]|nr:hypothetical protein [Priestia megaterium]
MKGRQKVIKEVNEKLLKAEKDILGNFDLASWDFELFGYNIDKDDIGM